MSLSYIFCHYYNILIMLSSRSISQNFLWLRETLLSESFPVTCTVRHSTLSYNSSVPALLGGVWGRGQNDCICAALHSSTLAWNIPWTEVPGRLQSMGSKELDVTEQLYFHFSLSRTGEGNGNPLHFSCLENPRDRGAWWAAVYGVAQSQTLLKRLSSSNSSQALDQDWLTFLVCF